MIWIIRQYSLSVFGYWNSLGMYGFMYIQILRGMNSTKPVFISNTFKCNLVQPLCYGFLWNVMPKIKWVGHHANASVPPFSECLAKKYSSLWCKHQALMLIEYTCCWFSFVGSIVNFICRNVSSYSKKSEKIVLKSKRYHGILILLARGNPVYCINIKESVICTDWSCI